MCGVSGAGQQARLGDGHDRQEEGQGDDDAGGGEASFSPGDAAECVFHVGVLVGVRQLGQLIQKPCLSPTWLTGPVATQ
ncbi:hypothetical protein GCM10020001_113620 [Nonomuraea salmonea]